MCLDLKYIIIEHLFEALLLLLLAHCFLTPIFSGALKQNK